MKFNICKNVPFNFYKRIITVLIKVILQERSEKQLNGRNLRTLYKEISKSLNNLFPVLLKKFLKNLDVLFAKKINLNFEIRKICQVRFGTKSIRSLGPKIWNTSPYHIKTFEKRDISKKIIKNWNEVNCKCLVCQKSA